MSNDPSRKLALALVWFNVLLMMLGMVFFWNSRRQAAQRPTVPTNLACVACAGDVPVQ